MLTIAKLHLGRNRLLRIGDRAAQIEPLLRGFDAEALRAFCRERLAGFKTPKVVVITDALPKNPSGKILKRQLRDEYAHVAQDQ